MIDEKKIEEAANINTDKYRYYPTISNEQRDKVSRESFIDGAKWTQEEFKKSLWHDASEEPEKNKLIIEKIFEEDGYDYELDCPTYSCRTWVEMVKIFDIIKWCYLDDILPQKGGSDV